MHRSIGVRGALNMLETSSAWSSAQGIAIRIVPCPAYTFLMRLTPAERIAIRETNLREQAIHRVARETGIEL